jgi:replicative DNA helicase|tara:strand:+ start:2908 stop:4149 length:1242 start_codon:yes stop_codon:yes gene_type:complete
LIETQIIKTFCLSRESYERYYKYVKLDYIKINYSNIYKIFNTIHSYYNKYDDKELITKEELDLSYNSNYLLKEQERKEVSTLIDTVFKTEITNSDAVIELLDEHRKRSLAGDIARISLDVEEGTASLDDLHKIYAEFDQASIEIDESAVVDMSLADLYQSQVATQGLRWRLKWLNQSLGSLRKGDFGFIFARPETGKTTFLASEVTQMIQQTEGNIVWFNNEEQGNKVAIRCYQAMLGLKTDELFTNVEENQAKFEALGGKRIKIYDYEDSSRANRIDAILKEDKPALIIIDQIDKVKGFKADRNDLELKAIYQWAREIAKKYAPVIAVSQAGGTGEGKLFLTMDDVDGSKTGKQGEADWILGIGKETDNTSRIRYFNICKNKLLGDADTLPDLRHGNSQVLIRPEVARYEDI